MTKRLLYLGAFLVFAFVSFQLYLQYHKWERQKPVVYIDNFSGSDIEIIRGGETWLEIKDQQTLVKKDLQAGKGVLYARKLDSGAVDTIKINIAPSAKYVINPFGEMAYAIGQIMYAKEPSSLTDQEADGVIKQITAARVIKFEADFIFEAPPVQVREYVQGGKNLPYQNYTVSKTFIRRLNGDDFPHFTRSTASAITEQEDDLQALPESVAEGQLASSAPVNETQGIALNGIDQAQVQEILTNLRTGDTEHAITNLAKLNENESAMLRERYEALHEQQLMGVVSFENWLIEQNKIDLSLFDALPLDGIAQQKMPTAEVQRLLEADEVAAAADVLIDAGHVKAVLIAGTLARAKKKYNQGVITKNVYTTILAKKKMAIRSMLN